MSPIDLSQPYNSQTSSNPYSQASETVQSVDNPLKAKLKWYEYLICGIPFILIAVGGGLGGALGVLAFLTNIKMWKSGKSVVLKIILILVITASSFIVWLVSGVVLKPIILNMFDSKGGSKNIVVGDNEAGNGSIGLKGWVTFSPPTNKFSILLPVSPTHESIPVPSSKISVDMYLSELGESAYTISLAEYGDLINSSTSTKEMLEASMKGLTDSNKNNTLISSDDIKYQGYPAKEYIVVQGPILMKGRMILAGKTLYTLGLAYPKSKPLPQDYYAFIDSLKIL